MKITWSKKIAISLLIVVAFVISNLPSINQYTNSYATAQAVSRKMEAIKAYKKYLGTTTQYWGSSEYKSSDFKFFLMDINEDGVKELIVDNPMAITADSDERIFSYYNGEMIELTSSFSGRVDKIYPDKHIIVISGAHTGEYWTYYYKMSNDAVEKVATIKGRDYIKNHEGTIVNTYYVNGDKSTKTGFNKYIKELLGDSMAYSHKLYANTAANRAKYLK